MRGADSYSDDDFPNKPMRRHRGFSLVEIVIGMTVFAITAAGIFSALVQSSILKEAAANELQATMLLNNEMEHLRALDWPQVEALPAKGAFEGISQNSQYSTTRLIATPATGQRDIKLLVSWKDGKGKSFTTSLVTLLTEYD